MAEITSLQAARAAASATGLGKLLPTDMGKIMAIVLDSPPTAAWAQNDTLATPAIIPPGAIPLGAFVRRSAFGASVTLDVGIRNANTGAVVDVDGLVAALDISAAGSGFFMSGSSVLNPVPTTVPCHMYATFAGANPTDDADITVIGLFLIPG